MQIKPGVILAGIQIQMNRALVKGEKLWKEYGQELVITGALDGSHSNMSLHYSGYALDFRTRYFSSEKHKEIAAELQKRLGMGFDVVVHKTHIHVEWDAAKQLLGRR